jgi:hypothetical protein
MAIITFTYTHGKPPAYSVILCFLTGIATLLMGILQLGLITLFPYFFRFLYSQSHDVLIKYYALSGRIHRQLYIHSGQLGFYECCSNNHLLDTDQRAFGIEVCSGRILAHCEGGYSAHDRSQVMGQHPEFDMYNRLAAPYGIDFFQKNTRV